jgi:hypothetical protein
VRLPSHRYQRIDICRHAGLHIGFAEVAGICRSSDLI